MRNDFTAAATVLMQRVFMTGLRSWFPVTAGRSFEWEMKSENNFDGGLGLEFVARSFRWKSRRPVALPQERN